jgi:hypothetical protein
MKTISYDPLSGRLDRSFQETASTPIVKCTLGHLRSSYSEVKQPDEQNHGEEPPRLLNRFLLDYSLKAIDLSGDSMVSHRIQEDRSSWNQVSNAQVAASGMSPRWMSRPEAGKAMWKTARSAANQMRCESSTIRRRRNSSSLRRWSEFSAEVAENILVVVGMPTIGYLSYVRSII